MRVIQFKVSNFINDSGVLSCQLQMSTLLQDGVRHKKAHPSRIQTVLKDELMANLSNFKAHAILIMDSSTFLLMLCSPALVIEHQCYSSPGLPCFGNIACFTPCRLYSSNTNIQSTNLSSCNRVMVRNRMRGHNGGSCGGRRRSQLAQATNQSNSRAFQAMTPQSSPPCHPYLYHSFQNYHFRF